MKVAVVLVIAFAMLIAAVGATFSDGDSHHRMPVATFSDGD